LYRLKIICLKDMRDESRTVMKIPVILIKTASLLVAAAVVFSSFPERRKIEIKPGESVSQIARALQEEEIVCSSLFFMFFLRISDRSTNIKAGTYKFYPRQSYFSIINQLVKGSDIYERVSIPEGFTAEQIAQRLKRKKIIDSKEEFVAFVEEKDLRGMLFPDTYRFSKGQNVKTVAGIMKRRFDEVFTEEFKDRAREIGFSVREVVTLASLIEREAGVSEEKPIISDVFHRRLERGIFLESCASVIFALGEHRNRLTYQDLRVDSPYNTYRNLGLPPTPICNPGEESLRAALYPAETDYMYFFSRGDGTHVFSRTYEEHLEEQRKHTFPGP